MLRSKRGERRGVVWPLRNGDWNARRLAWDCAFSALASSWALMRGRFPVDTLHFLLVPMAREG